MSRSLLRWVTLGLGCAVVLMLSTAGGSGIGAGAPSPARLTVDVSSPPVSAIYSVANSGACPAFGPFLWCNYTFSTPRVNTSNWTDRSNLANPASAAPTTPPSFLGVQSIIGGFHTSNVALLRGTHHAWANWTDSEAWAGLVSVLASKPCTPSYHSEFWLNVTGTLDVINSTGATVGTSTVTYPLTFKVVTTATSCANSLSFSGAGGPSLHLAVTFPSPSGGTYHETTTVTVTTVVGFTHDSCGDLGVDWGASGSWPWVNPGCPPGLAPPRLPPTATNTGMTLASSAIV